MPYEIFKVRINALLERAGGNLSVRFSHADGKHYANISDGTVIIANSTSPSMTVKWGSGHMAKAVI